MKSATALLLEASHPYLLLASPALWTSRLFLPSLTVLSFVPSYFLCLLADDRRVVISSPARLRRVEKGKGGKEMEKVAEDRNRRKGASFKLKLTSVERINGAIRDVFRSLNV